MSVKNHVRADIQDESGELETAVLDREPQGQHAASSAQRLRDPQAPNSYLDQQRFRQTIENAPIGMCIVGLDGSFLLVNSALNEMLGYTPEEFEKLSFQEITHPDDLEKDLEFLQQTLRGEISRYSMSKRYYHKRGTLVHATLHVSLVRDEQDEPVHFISQILDVTEQKRAVESLRKSEERFRLLTTRLPMGVFQTTVDGKLTFVNKRWSEMTGLSEEEALSQGIETAIHPKDIDHVKEEWKRQASEQREIILEHRIGAGGSGEHWRQVTATSFLDESGAPAGFLGVLIDIQDRKHVEELLRESNAQREIIEAQRAKLSEMSTPLIPIRDDIVVMPLVGTIDSERAAQVLETLLAGIGARSVRVAILDITGVAVVDEQVAESLFRAAQAVRLLGAQMVLSGIRPEVARVLVSISANFVGIETCANLQSAIAYATRIARSGNGR